MWSMWLLGTLTIVSGFARLRLLLALWHFVPAVVIDVVVIAIKSWRFSAHPLTWTAACLTLLACHVSVLISCGIHESLIRKIFARRLALTSFAAESDKRLKDLYPPFVVRALLNGVAPQHTISRGAVVLRLDIKGFTAVSAQRTPRKMMEVMDAIYTAFDVLVIEASKPDDELWKVDTVRLGGCKIA